MISLLFLLACTKTSDVATEPPASLPPTVSACAVTESWQDTEVPPEIVSAFESELDQTGASGVAFAILQGGDIRYAGALGMRDDDNGLQMEPDTLMRSGSTLKMQTAAALVVQSARGDLALSDTLATHLPEFSMAAQPGQAEGTTIHQLISHQGGFYDYTPIDGPAGENALYNHAHNVFAADYWMMSPPGSFWNYSNPNFSLAGLIAQEASGRPYATVMREDLWEPLCMDRTFLTAEEVLEDGRYASSTGFNWEGGVLPLDVEPDSYDHGFAKPAGFAWSSTQDMLRFADFVMAGHDSLTPNGENLLLTDPHADTAYFNEEVLQYGYGIFLWDRYPATVDTWKDVQVWEHGGDIPGYAADLWMLPEHDLAIAVLANGDGAHFTNSLLATVEHLVDIQDAPAPDNTFDLTLLDDIEGTYDDPWNVGRLTFTREGDTLRLEAPLLDDLDVSYSSTLTPLDATRFLWDVQNTTIAVDFVPGPTGRAHFFRHRAFVAERNNDRSAAGPAVPHDRVEAWLYSLETRHDVSMRSFFPPHSL